MNNFKYYFFAQLQLYVAVFVMMTPQKNMSMKWVWQNTECNLQTYIQISIDRALHNVPVNYKTTHPPRAIPQHLTRIKLRTVGNLTQNEARPLGHLTFVSKRLSAVGNKRIAQFFAPLYSTWAAFTGHCPCWFHVGFSVVVVLYSYIVEYAFV